MTYTAFKSNDAYYLWELASPTSCDTNVQLKFNKVQELWDFVGQYLRDHIIYCNITQ